MAEWILTILLRKLCSTNDDIENIAIILKFISFSRNEIISIGNLATEVFGYRRFIKIYVFTRNVSDQIYIECLIQYPKGVES